MSEREPIKLYGVEELLSKLANPVWAHKPARGLFERWGSHVERVAKDNLREHSWRHQLQRSVTHEVDKSAFPKWAKAGTNVEHAKPVEYGTGLLSDAPDSKHRRYFPPPAKLDAWAIAHGFHTERTATAARRSVGLLGDGATTAPGTYGLIVAQIIWRRGGTKPVRFLRNAAADAEQKIPHYLELMAREIEEEAERGS